MLLDNKNFFCEKKALTDSTATSDWIDLKDGAGILDATRLIFIGADVTAAGGTSVNFEVQTSEDKSTVVSLVKTGDITTASFVAGDWLARIPWPRGTRRYVRIKANVTAEQAAPFTAGKYTAFVAAGDHVGV